MAYYTSYFAHRKFDIRSEAMEHCKVDGHFFASHSPSSEYEPEAIVFVFRFVQLKTINSSRSS